MLMPPRPGALPVSEAFHRLPRICVRVAAAAVAKLELRGGSSQPPWSRHPRHPPSPAARHAALGTPVARPSQPVGPQQPSCGTAPPGGRRGWIGTSESHPAVAAAPPAPRSSAEVSGSGPGGYWTGPAGGHPAGTGRKLVASLRQPGRPTHLAMWLVLFHPLVKGRNDALEL